MWTSAPCSLSASARVWPMNPAPPMRAMRLPATLSMGLHLCDRPPEGVDHRLDVLSSHVRPDGERDRLRADPGRLGTRTGLVAVSLAVEARVRKRLRIVDAR